MVELTLVLPILFLITAGTIETYSTLLLCEAVTVAAYEGARVAVQRRSTDSVVNNKAMRVLNDRNILASGIAVPVVSITPDVTTVTVLQPITVTVSAPTNGDTVFPCRGLLGFRTDGCLRQFKCERNSRTFRYHRNQQ